MHSTLLDGSSSKHDQHSNDSSHSSDSGGVRGDSSDSDSSKLQTSQTSGQSSLSLTLTLPNQSELLPIAEEKDSPGGSSKADPESESNEMK